MKSFLFCTVASTAIVMSSAAMAQTVDAQQQAQAADAPQAADAATSNESALGEVVVTANRRAENAQKAPVTVTAVGSDALAKQNVKEFADLSTALPNTQVSTSGGARIVIAVRGIRNNDFSPGAESPVAVHIDGSYIPRMTGLAGLFYDISRVESLPGPQGTLYGRNAAAGAINIITNHPVNRFEGAGEIEGGGYGLFRGFGMINVPVTDEFAVRGAFQRYQHNSYNKAGGDDADQTSGRLSAQWKHDRLTVFASADYTSIGGKGSIDNDLDNPPYDSTAIYTRASKQIANVSVHQRGAMVQADYDLDFATLTGQYSNRLSNESSWTRGSGQLSYFNFKSRANIGELRLTSKGAGPVTWVVGAFAFDEKQPSYGVVSADQSNPFGNGGTCDASNATPDIPACGNYLPQLNLRTRSYAFFGQTTVTPIDGLHFTGGLRYSHDRKDYAGAYLCQVGGTGSDFDLSTCQNPPIPIDTGKFQKTHKINYKAGVSYDVTNTSMVYANVSTGYRAGGSFISPFFPTYGPENITAYEAGWKNSFFNHRLVVNVDAYRQVYDDYIFTYNVSGDIVPVPGVFVPFQSSQADNLGKVTINGADLTVAFLATKHDLINFGAEYIHTKVGKATLRCTATVATDNGPCAAVNFVSPQGLPLPNTPSWRLTGSYEHTFELPGGGTIVPRIQTHYESGRYMEIFQAPGTYQKAFTKTDVSIDYAPADKNWNIGAWVQNLENKAVFQNAGSYNGTLTSLYPSGYSVIYRAPRTWGVKFGAKF